MKFKRVKLMGKNLDDVRPKILERNMEIVDENFDLVIAHGGDGTLLWAERDFPGVPKLALRDARTAPQCINHSYDKVLDALLKDELETTVLPKLECLYNGSRLIALNDIFVHNLERASALRYKVWIDDELYANEIVGDSVGVATVHGCTAYYRSITQSLFRVGLGLAFSNSTEEINHLVIDDKSEVKIRIIRGPGLVITDNSPKTMEVPNQGEVIIRTAP
jgi:NAD+ kinase